jgi:GT2 family glycosyltransferase
MATAQQGVRAAQAAVPSPDGPGSPCARPRVAGKFFHCGGRRLRVRGVTYGPFAPGDDGQPFPDARRAAEDFATMRAAGFNAVRTYHLPPGWLLDLADEQGLHVFIDVPWPKHLCFLDSARAQQEARLRVREAAKRGRDHASVLAYSIGNEVPPSVVRWHGARRIERFLADLRDEAKQADRDGLVTYASFPPTEYLDLSAFDFATFNVYLHNREAFRRYLCRLQNLVGDRPLLLGEIGMDTLRNGEEAQAHFLAGHLEEAILMGLAGAFVFSWTDDWYTGGHPIRDWAFGITAADRTPKVAYQALREIFDGSPADRLQRVPRVSIVVCTYNGGRTLEQCLRSLLALDYPDYEVIVVDDGSTDDTPAILAGFPGVRTVRQPNQGLSVARNIGLREATGDIVAYTDSDCFADADWATHLVYQLERSGAVAVGGPNLTPEDGWLAACVAAAPGQPTHVLESEQVAEHIPGCNMAFRREALLAINGFDPQFRKAGDDVDVCWRLQQAGAWITFAPGAFVWHHRRQGPRAYLRQQAGYGEAEALLRFKHPDKFNGRGDGKWRGVMYGASLQGLRFDQAIIYRGTFGTGLFQCLYQPAPAHWAMLPSTLEWHAAAALLALSALFWWPALIATGVMLVLSLFVACLQAAQARLAPERDGWASRVLVAALCYAQPLVRSWKRYCTRLLSYRPPISEPALAERRYAHMPLSGTLAVAYWSEEGCERTRLLDRVLAYLNEHAWGKVIDTGWSNWDLQLHCHPWTIVEVCTAEEDHGGGKRMLRVRYRLRAGGYIKALCGTALAVAPCAFALQEWWALAGAAGLLALAVGLWWRGMRRATQAVGVFDVAAAQLKLLRCDHPTAADLATRPANRCAGGTSCP